MALGGDGGRCTLRRDVCACAAFAWNPCPCASQNKRKVINMSLGGGVNAALDAAVNAAVANGVVVAVAAGNSNTNACTFSPARAPAGVCVCAESCPADVTTRGSAPPHPLPSRQ